MTDAIEYVTAPDVPAPAGHYSHAAAWRDLVFVAGQLPIDADGKPMAGAPFEAQAAQALSNLVAILRAAGSSPERTLKVTVYIVGIGHWPAFNRAYAAAFGDARPARAVVPVPELHHGCLVEVEAVAAR